MDEDALKRKNSTRVRGNDAIGISSLFCGEKPRLREVYEYRIKKEAHL